MIVEIAKDFSSSIHFYLDSSEINAKSVLGIITLGAAYGSEIKMTAEGPDEKAALDALEKVFNSKFEEE
ncbi:MAG: HPr family phosphocarrier protein [Termitinemataceae bacterium]|nr:MAG: HPr family phosphocarrier protein [Termitinemataceae bacterium]